MTSKKHHDSSPISPAALQHMAEHADDAAGLLKALANPHRLQILCVLGAGELSVSELNDFVHLSQSALSQHLAKLRSDGLVDTRRESQTIFYALRRGPAHEIIEVLHRHFCAADEPRKKGRSRR